MEAIANTFTGVLLSGRIVSGLGSASVNVPMQMPFFKTYEPRLTNCHPATLNVLLDAPLVVVRWDIDTGKVNWKRKPHRGERFSFLEIAFFYNDARYEGWIYYARNSPHCGNLFNAELMLPWIPITGSKFLLRRD